MTPDLLGVGNVVVAVILGFGIAAAAWYGCQRAEIAYDAAVKWLHRWELSRQGRRGARKQQ